MSRAMRLRERRRRQVLRNRRIAAICTIVLFAVTTSILFHNFSVQAEKPDTQKYYADVRVERGETLWDIAMEYMTEEYSSASDYIREVKEINGIGATIEYGQCLVVPYYSEEIK